MKRYIMLKSIFVAVATLALFIRFLGLGDSGFEFDTIITQHTWANAALEMGFWNFWASYDKFLDYLPSSIYLGMLIKFIAGFFDDSPYTFVLVFKVFNTFVDGLLAVFVYHILRTKLGVSKVKSGFTSLLLFISPAVVIISSYWGQFDSLIVLLTLTVLYLLFFEVKYVKTNQYILAGAIYALAISLKMQPVLFIIPIGLVLVSHKKIKTILEFVSSFSIFFFVCNLIPVLANLPRTLVVFAQPFVREDSLSNGANTFWVLFPQFKHASDSLLSIGNFSLSVGSISNLMFVFIIAASILNIYRLISKFPFFTARFESKQLNFILIMALAVIINLTYFMFMPKMHSRYAHFAVIYAIILLPFVRGRVWKWITITCVILFQFSYFLNQLFVYYWWYREKFAIDLMGLATSNILTSVLIMINLVTILVFIKFLNSRKLDIQEK